MAPLGAISQAWTSAEVALPLGWRVSGLYRFEDLWVGLAEGPDFDDYASGSGLYADPERRLGDRLRERRVGDGLADVPDHGADKRSQDRETVLSPDR